MGLADFLSRRTRSERDDELTERERQEARAWAKQRRINKELRSNRSASKLRRARRNIERSRGDK